MDFGTSSLTIDQENGGNERRNEARSTADS
jgi:hypothetical protein